MSEKNGQLVPAPQTIPTDRELVVSRVAQANATISEFVTALFEGVRGKIDELRVDLSAELATQRVSDAMARLDEINSEVQALANEAVAATDPVTFRLLLTKIAILKTTFTSRYRTAIAAVPGAPDEPTIAKEVKILFDAVIKDIGERRSAAEVAPRPLPAAPIADPIGAAAAIGAAVSGGSTEPPVASSPVHLSSVTPVPVPEPEVPEPEVPEPEVPEVPEPEVPEPEVPEPEVPEPVGAAPGRGEPVPMLIPQVGLLSPPRHKHKNGRR